MKSILMDNHWTYSNFIRSDEAYAIIGISVLLMRNGKNIDQYNFIVYKLVAKDNYLIWFRIVEERNALFPYPLEFRDNFN